MVVRARCAACSYGQLMRLLKVRDAAAILSVGKCAAHCQDIDRESKGDIKMHVVKHHW